ncbi:Nup53/35/40-type RNA recognition motif-domain-containing protein [Scheffersomyces xylosifermentans]|uniref:Nup53/35/40-type RNA recognition motif-domain-containing protein n=1 Tax=Scheffersomyces xylosifermentans TaxID=1304137 RepID=UPI00315D1610
MSTLFGQSTIAGNSNVNLNHQNTVQQPTWFQNQKKRTIPNHLVPKKKPGFQITASTTSKSKKDSDNSNKSLTSSSNNNDRSSALLSSNDQFNIMSFGNQQRKSGILDRRTSVGTLFDTASNDLTRYDETINDTISDDLYNNTLSYGDDLPPTRSIHDLNNEILISLNKPVQQIDSFINKDPKNFNNVFNRAENGAILDETSDGKTSGEERRGSINPLAHSESAILVFGYPESLSNHVIQHFKEFGDILENFEVNQKMNSLLHNSSQLNSKVIPIFCGKNWVKITFDNPASAVDALQENGVVFNGVLLGVIPYSKNAIEKLQKRKLTDNEDIGGGNIDLSSINVSLNDKKEDVKQQPAASANPSTYTTRLDIKDGSQLFLKSDGDQIKNNTTKNANEEKLGFLGNLTKFVFGFHEL